MFILKCQSFVIPLKLVDSIIKTDIFGEDVYFKKTISVEQYKLQSLGKSKIVYGK